MATTMVSDFLLHESHISSCLSACSQVTRLRWKFSFSPNQPRPLTFPFPPQQCQSPHNSAQNTEVGLPPLFLVLTIACPRTCYLVHYKVSSLLPVLISPEPMVQLRISFLRATPLPSAPGWSHHFPNPLHAPPPGRWSWIPCPAATSLT